MNIASLSKAKRILLSVFALILLLPGYYLAVYQSFGYQSNNLEIGLTVIFISLLFISILWLNAKDYTNQKPNPAKLIFIIVGAGMGVISIVLIVDYAKENYLRHELYKNGIKTTAVVVDFEYETIKSSEIAYATIKYKLGSQEVIQRFKTFNSRYSIGQTLPVNISTSNPEMFEIIESEK